MSTETWNTVQKKSDATSDKLYCLSDFLNEGGCLRCVKGNCRNPPTHSLPFPAEFADYVKNPTKIDGFLKAISATKLDFSKAPFYTICDYVNGRCRNCEEGRIKYVIYKEQKIGLCYPGAKFDKSRNKVTIGLHIDVEVIKKGARFEGRIIPISINCTKQNARNSKDMPPVEQDFKQSDKDAVFSLDDFAPLSVIGQPPSVVHIDPKQSDVKQNNLDFSKVTQNIDNEIFNIEENKRKHIESTMISISKESLMNLKTENDYLRFENTRQYTKIKLLEQELSKLRYSNHDPKLVEEALHNMKRLNSRVSADFMNSQYSVFSY